MKKGLSTNVRSVIVLTAICLVVAALLAVTNHVTAPVIKDTREKRIAESLSAVLPNSGAYREIELDESIKPSTVQKVYYFPDDGSYAVVLSTVSAYSSGDMGITVGINSRDAIEGIKLTSYMESKDFGQDTYPQSFIGKNEYGSVTADSVSGVTYSSTAFKKALEDAFTAVKLAKGGAVG